MNSVSKRQSEGRSLGCVLGSRNKGEAVFGMNGTGKYRKQSEDKSLQGQERAGARERPVQRRKWAAVFVCFCFLMS